MNRRSKIGIRYYLEKKVKPRKQFYELTYPVYVQVVYKGKNSGFKLLSLGSPHDYYSERDFEETNFENLFHKEENYIRLIVRHEEKKLGEKFTLKGLGKRLKLYFEPIQQILGSILDEFLSSKLDKLNLHKPGAQFFKRGNLLDKYSFTKEVSSDFKDNLVEEEIVLLASFFYLDLFVRKEETDVLNVDWLLTNKKQEFSDLLKRSIDKPKVLSQIPHFSDEIVNDFPLSMELISAIENRITEVVVRAFRER